MMIKVFVADNVTDISELFNDPYFSQPSLYREFDDPDEANTFIEVMRKQGFDVIVWYMGERG